MPVMLSALINSIDTPAELKADKLYPNGTRVNGGR